LIEYKHGSIRQAWRGLRESFQPIWQAEKLVKATSDCGQTQGAAEEILDE